MCSSLVLGKSCELKGGTLLSREGWRMEIQSFAAWSSVWVCEQEPDLAGGYCMLKLANSRSEGLDLLELLPSWSDSIELLEMVK
jgi:hypothetical protein